MFHIDVRLETLRHTPGVLGEFLLGSQEQSIGGNALEGMPRPVLAQLRMAFNGHDLLHQFRAQKPGWISCRSFSNYLPFAVQNGQSDREVPRCEPFHGELAAIVS